MFLEMRQGVINDPLKLFDVSKQVGHDGHHEGWVVLTNLGRETYMGQLEWARSQTTKMTQIRGNKSSPI
jgi:hypothetical protein